MCVYVSVCLVVVCLSTVRLERKENEKETDTNRQYMFLICPVCVFKKESRMVAADISVPNV